MEYRPPRPPSLPFAVLDIVFPDALPPQSEIVRILELESRGWVNKYPITLMASDGTGALCDLPSVGACKHLTAFIDTRRNEPVLLWRLLKNDELPDLDLSLAGLMTVCAGIPYKTRSDIDTEVQKEARQLKVGWLIVFVWAAVIPAMIAILGWASPVIGLITTFYALWQACAQALKLLGKRPKSKRDREAEERAHAKPSSPLQGEPQGLLAAQTGEL